MAYMEKTHMLAELSERGLVTADNVALLTQDQERIADNYSVFLGLENHNLLTQENIDVVFNHQVPHAILNALVVLNQKGLLNQSNNARQASDPDQMRYALGTHQDPIGLAKAISRMHNAGLLERCFDALVEYDQPQDLVLPFCIYKETLLEDPDDVQSQSMAYTISRLYACGLLTGDNVNSAQAVNSHTLAELLEKLEALIDCERAKAQTIYNKLVDRQLELEDIVDYENRSDTASREYTMIRNIEKIADGELTIAEIDAIVDQPDQDGLAASLAALADALLSGRGSSGMEWGGDQALSLLVPQSKLIDIIRQPDQQHFAANLRLLAGRGFFPNNDAGSDRLSDFNEAASKSLSAFCRCPNQQKLLQALTQLAEHDLLNYDSMGRQVLEVVGLQVDPVYMAETLIGMQASGVLTQANLSALLRPYQRATAAQTTCPTMFSVGSTLTYTTSSTQVTSEAQSDRGLKRSRVSSTVMFDTADLDTPGLEPSSKRHAPDTSSTEEYDNGT